MSSASTQVAVLLSNINVMDESKRMAVLKMAEVLLRAIERSPGLATSMQLALAQFDMKVENGG